uniref:Uncharacterized protein n=1 Tax=Noctiluca scintillans TaxID=2966 RepID=A0A7S0ZST6_NOCSC|mmetsp:Transcript_16875/g.45722  ORF Transcript_16875/g.45722 Transcript_16875/m.45722 type:complete len:273 (+) Transcript_16875:60-878(+)
MARVNLFRSRVTSLSVDPHRVRSSSDGSCGFKAKEQHLLVASSRKQCSVAIAPPRSGTSSTRLLRSGITNLRKAQQDRPALASVGEGWMQSGTLQSGRRSSSSGGLRRVHTDHFVLPDLGTLKTKAQRWLSSPEPPSSHTSTDEGTSSLDDFDDVSSVSSVMETPWSRGSSPAREMHLPGQMPEDPSWFLSFVDWDAGNHSSPATPEPSFLQSILDRDQRTHRDPRESEVLHLSVDSDLPWGERLERVQKKVVALSELKLLRPSLVREDEDV